MTFVIWALPDIVMEFNEGRRGLRPPAKGDLIHEVRDSRSVAGGGDVGTECSEHKQEP
jgi:hypothetical protein